jgi:hypothetical protein
LRLQPATKQDSAIELHGTRKSSTSASESDTEVRVCVGVCVRGLV